MVGEVEGDVEAGHVRSLHEHGDGDDGVGAVVIGGVGGNQ
jgi:hypothetical protein